MNRLIVASFILVYTGLNAHAQDVPSSLPSYQIRQIILDQKVVVASTSNANENLTAGKIFLVTFSDGKQCSLSLKEKNGSLLILNTSLCDRAIEITKNTPIEVALIDSQAQSVGTAPVVNEKPKALEPIQEPKLEVPHKVQADLFKKIGISFHYSGAREMYFDNAYYSSSSASGPLDITFGSNSSLGFGLSFLEVAPQSWGYQTNFLYEPNREINSMTATGSGGTATAFSTGVPPKISFLIFESNLVHRWESFYLPIGVNYNIPTITIVGNSTSTLNYSGGLGVYLGGGVLLSDKMSVELFLRSISMRMTETSGSTIVSYDAGTLSGVGFSYKFWF